MMIIGCDFHPSWQQVSWLDTETGETGEQKLGHASLSAVERVGSRSKNKSVPYGLGKCFALSGVEGVRSA
jgi:hypothetical protein